MIIHSNSQASGHGTPLNPAGGFLAKQANQVTQNQKEPDASRESEDTVASSRIGYVQTRVAEISDSNEAEDAVRFARNHILSNPRGSIGVQANSSPSAVLELLGDLIYS